MRFVAAALVALLLVSCGSDDDGITVTDEWATITDPATGRSFRCFDGWCYEP